MNHQSKLDEKFATRKRIHREEIKGHPTVEKYKCTGGIVCKQLWKKGFNFKPERL